MTPRGLPRRGVAPLLKTIGGKQRSGVPKPLDEPEDVTAPPIGSSESEDEELEPAQQYQDSSDDDGQPARGDIVRSTFGSAQISTTVRSAGGQAVTKSAPKTAGRANRSSSKRVVDDIEDADAQGDDVFKSGKKAKTSGGKASSSLGSHMNDGYMVERQKKPLKVGFGKNAKKSKNADSSRDSSPRKTFQVPKSMSPSISPEKTKVFKTTHFETDRSSPVPESKPTKDPKHRVQSETSELSELDSSVYSDPPRPLKGGRKVKRDLRQPKKGKKKAVKELTPEDVSEKPKFMMPEGYDEFALRNEPARVDMSADRDSKPSRKTVLPADKALCPMCDEPVDKEWLGKFSRNMRMSIARQAKFCHLHKKRSAEETWAAKRYPDIKWEDLKSRIAGRRGFLESLINGQASYFGDVHREKIETGKDRTLLKTEDYLTPGYYGLRGMGIMTETIVEMFSALLRERAPKYKLISARGYMGFVQSVLVPELAVKLIQDDMSLDGEGAAREVMEESRAIGEILNDEKRESQSQTRDKSNGTGHEGTAREKPDISGKRGGGDQDVSVDLKIQRVDDSDSDLSSLASLGKEHPIGTRKRASKSKSDVSGLASPGKKHSAGVSLDIEDSESDLSSLGDLS